MTICPLLASLPSPYISVSSSSSFFFFQLMPYFVMEIFDTMPGLPGLFVACAFSGTLRLVCWQTEDDNGCGGSGKDRNDNGRDHLSTENLLRVSWPTAMLYFYLITGITQHGKKNLYSHSRQFADKETDLIRMREATTLCGGLMQVFS